MVENLKNQTGKEPYLGKELTEADKQKIRDHRGPYGQHQVSDSDLMWLDQGLQAKATPATNSIDLETVIDSA